MRLTLPIILVLLFSFQAHADLKYQGGSLWLKSTEWQWLDPEAGYSEQEQLSTITQLPWQQVPQTQYSTTNEWVWIKVDIDIQPGHVQPLVFFANNAFTEKLSLFFYQGEKLLYQTEGGSKIPIEMREVPHPHVAITLSPEQAGLHSLVIRVPRYNVISMAADSRLISHRHFVYEMLPANFSIAAGVVGALITYAFFLTVLLCYHLNYRHIFGLMFVVSALLAIASREGLLYQLLGSHHVWWYQNFAVSMVMFTNASAALYLQHSLRRFTNSRWFILPLQIGGLTMLITALSNLYVSLFVIPFIGLLAYAIVVLSFLYLIAAMLYYGYRGNWLDKGFAAIWVTFIVLTSLRFLRAWYPAIEFNSPVWWSIVAMTAAAWIFLEHLLFAIGERFKREKKKSVAETRIDLVNRLSHELRTPLNAVIGLSDLLRTGKDSSAANNYAGMIQDAGQSLLSLVNDILDFSKLENSSAPLNKEPFRVDVLLQEINAGFVPIMIESKVQAYYYIDPEMEYFYSADKIRIAQIFTNLISNAFKFSQRYGEVSVNIKPGEQQGERQQLLCSVHDTGRGIPEDMLEAIFDPYQQTSPTDATVLKGTGLGLTICKLLVEQMGGEINVHSKEGEGTLFSFDIWVDRVTDAPDLNKLFAPLKSRSVLIVSNIKGLSWPMRHHFARFGAEVVHATNIDKALSLDNKPDIIICDNIFSINREGLDQLLAHYPEAPLLLIEASPKEGFEELPPQVHCGGISTPLLGVLSKVTSILTGQACIIDYPKRDIQPCASYKHRVAIVDDNLVNLTVGGKLLSSLGVECLELQSGKALLKTLAEKPGYYSLVLLDCEMPQMDGFETCQRWRAEEKRLGLQPLPIVALTAHALNEVTDRCIECGMNEVLYKPVNRNTLSELLAKYPA